MFGKVPEFQSFGIFFQINFAIAKLCVYLFHNQKQNDMKPKFKKGQFVKTFHPFYAELGEITGEVVDVRYLLDEFVYTVHFDMTPEGETFNVSEDDLNPSSVDLKLLLPMIIVLLLLLFILECLK